MDAHMVLILDTWRDHWNCSAAGVHWILLYAHGGVVPKTEGIDGERNVTCVSSPAQARDLPREAL